MKIYNTTFDLNSPSNKIVNVPQFSTFGLGFKFVKNGTALTNTLVKLYDAEEITEENPRGQITNILYDDFDGYIVFSANGKTSAKTLVVEWYEELTSQTPKYTCKINVQVNSSEASDIDQIGSSGGLQNVGVGLVKNGQTVSIDSSVVGTYDGTTLKLGDNEYDMNDVAMTTSTVEFAGEYEDGETFYYNVVIAGE